jgi:hypothetical protein
MPEPLQQVCVSLPPNLVALVQRHASESDRTIGGMIRHVVAEWARSQPRAGTGFSDAFAPPVPGVPATVEGIAAAKDRVAKLRQEQEQLRRRKARWQTTIDEDTRVDRLVAEIEIMDKRIALAEKMMPRSRNGG